MLFSYGSGQQRIDNNEKCRQIAGNFDCYADAVVQRGAHHPIEHIKGFTRSHRMPPSAKCLCRIAPAATMVNKFEWNTYKSHFRVNTWQGGRMDGSVLEISEE